MEGALKRAAFIGLGVMGYPMAGHLAKAGLEVTVFNRTQEKALRWAKEFGGRAAETPREAASGADIVFICVGRDKDVREVVYGDRGALAGMRKGAILWDDTTDSALLARELYDACSKAGVGFVDAPVSGGQSGAEKGVLTVMCGGDEDVVERGRSAAMAFSCAVTRIGGPGSGQLAKMMNQICIAGIVQGLAEAVAFGQNAGLDIERVLPVLEKGAAGSWQMTNRGSTMAKGEFDFGFATEWMRKDLGIALDEARRNGSSLPLTALVDQFYGDVASLGGRRWDTSSLIARLPRKKP
ncbi:MAG: NAD(P)-dependent oxidoreductase [Sutterellaceae bacterium]|nr:NAD(P)-dependent oxidoreductase [Sutterellaceae bacterium]MDD7442114.1 NAD(P)-dependent oxidoreductase [Sutterellaceae bacterium]MDY2868099.1 NAD(P)-dependent oxidoreductase [Mesosutterella sp.]